MDKIQKIGVTGFLHHQGKVLILRRSKKEKFLPGYYDMPGGKVEFGESLEEALKREMKEETNLVVKNMKPYASFSYLSSENKRHNIDVQFIVEATGIKNFKISSSHDESKWICEADIKKYKITKETKQAIKKGFKEVKK